MVSFLTDKWGIQKEGLLVYFSGYKGFHIMLDIMTGYLEKLCLQNIFTLSFQKRDIILLSSFN